MTELSARTGCAGWTSPGAVQCIYGILKPSGGMALVRLDPIQLDGLSFSNLEFWPI